MRTVSPQQDVKRHLSDSLDVIPEVFAIRATYSVCLIVFVRLAHLELI